MSSISVPPLPIELQDEIFEIAARKSWTIALRLTQVSKAISLRMKPILFEVIVIHINGLNDPVFYPAYIRRQVSNSIDVLSFFKQNGRHIRCLSIDPPYQDIESIIPLFEHCPSLQNLVSPIQYSNEIIQAIQHHVVRLHRLSGKFEYCIPAFDATKPVWKDLTHLDMVGAYSWEGCSPFLAALPSLTHMALNDPDTDDKMDDMVLGVLEGCKKLKVMLLVSEPGHLEEACVEARFEPNDDRVVVLSVLPLDSWLIGLRGEMDMWSFGDRRVRERQKAREDGVD